MLLKVILLIYVLIGTIINLSDHSSKAEEYANQLLNGEFNFIRFILRGFGIILFWPVAVLLNRR
jgi:hypothetical protein